MRRVLTFISLLTVTPLWADWPGESGAHTGAANGANALPTATGSASASAIGMGDLTGGASPSPAQTPAPSVPPCAKAAPPISLPPEFPKSFPLPPGTVITASQHAGPTIVLEGFIPMELKEATRFFVQKLPDAGFRLGRGEVERGEAESRFGGNGVAGFFKVRIIEGCPGALQFTVRVQSVESLRSPDPKQQ
jgi:hypothetical protein